MAMVLSPSSAQKKARKISTVSEKLLLLEAEINNVLKDAKGSLLEKELKRVHLAIQASLDKCELACECMDSVASQLEGLFSA